MNSARWLWLGVLAMTVASSVVGAADGIELVAGELRLRLLPSGAVAECAGPPQARPLLAATEHPVFLLLKWQGQEHEPTALRLDAATGRLEAVYGDTGVTAVCRVQSALTHLRLTLEEVHGASPESGTLLSLPVALAGSVGATVGVIRDTQSAMGLQALNLHTAVAAGKTPWGGWLVATARADQGGVIGADVALFACPAAAALERIGQIELAEGLPHPLLDGEWNKTSPTAARPYLIIPYGVDNLDEVLALAQRGGFRYVYHPGPFETWGHFVLNRGAFPSGDQSLQACAEKAAAVGIRLGLHTLTGFITPNDAYVTPVPEARLARLGSSRLAAEVTATAVEIPVLDAAPFSQRQTLATVIIGSELATYEAVREGPTPLLTGVQRGAFGTTAVTHAQGEDIGKLADHEYRTFYPGVANGMVDDLTARLVELGNLCDLAQISFDGLEGLSTYEGGGDYPRNRFVDQCHRGWQHPVISDASNLLHYTWHWHTRMNWGELTQSAKMDVNVYRARNCEYFRDNLFPAAMGWWRIGTTELDWEATRLEDVEYLLAKAAGNRATHGLATDPGILQRHGLAGAIFDLVREWEEARFGGAFTDTQLAGLREPGRDVHLRRVGARAWELVPVSYAPFHWLCSGVGRQASTPELSFAAAGPPRPASPWPFSNPYHRQPLRFEVRCLPAYDYAHPENIDLQPAESGLLRREAGLHQEAPVLTVSPDGSLGGLSALRLSATYTGTDKPSFVTRVCASLPTPLDLSRHRGLGLWVEGDGKGETLFVEIQDGQMVRPYYVPIDFSGSRYIELPLGEVSLSRYYDYEWNNWSSFASWWVTLKGFNYGHVAMVTLGFNAIPPGTAVSCRVAGIKALRELPANVETLTVELAGQRLSYSCALEPFQYLVDEGAGPAQVYGPNDHALRQVERRGEIVLEPGPNRLTLASTGSGPAPWLRFQARAVGSPEGVQAK